MRSLIVLALLVGACVWLVAARPAGLKNAVKNVAWTVNGDTTNDETSSDDCRERLHLNLDEFRTTVRDEETRSLPNQPLTITGEHNGGIQVTSWDQQEFSIKLCKQAAADNDSDARALLAETRLTIDGSNVSVSAPDSHHGRSLGTLLMVKAPRNATLNLKVRNGGVSVNRFIGTVEAHANNGGIAFKNSSGKLTAEAQNGGISISDCGGEIAANVQNGGVSVILPERWDGKGLEAHSQNGGIVLAVPHDFGGGMEIVGSEYSGIICKGSICDGAERTVDNGRRVLRVGGANPQIHASTVNGGIVIRERRGEL
jgi:DUF4097 and DUF4098 domain-containing protein YvlB